MHFFHIRISLLFLCVLNILNAQTTPISGIINHYAVVSAIDTCTGQLSVSDTTGFRAGASVLLIQMQGASIITSNDATYGHIQSLNAAGLYERAVVDSVGTGVLFLKKRLRNTYNISGVLQVLSFPEYPNAVVTDTLRPKPWDGNTGGVLAFRVIGTLMLDAPIIADGAGFRGGAAFPGPGNNCNFLVPQTSYFYESGNWRSANKGEGVAVRETGKELGRGPQANGGGGGNDHNAGGGGGGNMLMGGRGGDNDEPGFLNCQGYYPGLGGRGLGVSADRIFLGGGGGAGHANNDFTNSGGNGGGIILIQADSIAGNLPFISANGIDASTANGDGGGGGGAGGTIRLETNAALPGLIVWANGGNGGDTENNGQNRCFGPGGGGSGGGIWSNTSIATPMGGEPGQVTGSSNACNGASNNAMAGDPGLVFPLSDLPEDTLLAYVPQIFADPQAKAVCEGEPALFTVSTNFGNWLYQWQLNDSSGWQNIMDGQGFSGFQSDSLLLEQVGPSQNGYQFRCVVTRPGCSERMSDEAELSVLLIPAAGFNMLVNGQVVGFTNTSVSSTAFFWDFGDSTTTNETNPQHTYTGEGPYTIVLYAINTCDTAIATQTLVFEFPPEAGFEAPDSILDCQLATIDFANTSSPNATSFEWHFPGGNPDHSILENPTVSYLNSGTYTAELIASNAIGADTFVLTFFVQVLDFPVAAFSYTAGPSNFVQFTNLSQGGDVYIWDFGDGSPTDTVFSPSHTYAQAGIYTITLLVTNSCGGAALQQMINTVPVGTSEGQEFGQIHLFPNPAGGILNVDCGIQPIELQVFDQKGQLLLSKKEGLCLQTAVSLEDLPAGVYALLLRFEGGVVIRQFVKM